LQSKNAEANERARRIVDYVNHLIANNPEEQQQYLFAYIAMDLNVDVADVRSAIEAGGHNGISLRVTPEDRLALSRYKTFK
jgi:hypothetical protein